MPTDVATAAINIAHNPTANVATLYGLSTASTQPFSPTLGSIPNDFTIAININVASLGAGAIAIDASGNAWFTGGKITTTGAVVGFNCLDALGNNDHCGLSYPEGIAIDASGNIWVSNSNPANQSGVVELNSSGNPVYLNCISVPCRDIMQGYTGGGIYDPYGIAIDTSGNVWVTNPGNWTLSELNKAGAGVSGSPFAENYDGVAASPFGIAIDSSGAFISGIAFAANTYDISSSNMSSCINEPFGLAYDSSGNLWVTNSGNNSVSRLIWSGCGVVSSGFSNPQGITIDGSGNAWVANNGGNNVIELSLNGAILSGSSGFNGFNAPVGIAIDGSGNVWVTNSNNSAIELVGAATPVVTPLVANMMTPYNVPASKP
jgi:streptogramin lyase